MRIANAIAELRRPPSVMSENPPTSSSLAFPTSMTSPAISGRASSFRSHSQSQSIATTATHLSSPFTPASLQQAFTSPRTENGDSIHHVRRDSDPGLAVGGESQATIGFGLGIPTSVATAIGSTKGAVRIFMGYSYVITDSRI
jgi:hypothetical protein